MRTTRRANSGWWIPTIPKMLQNSPVGRQSASSRCSSTAVFEATAIIEYLVAVHPGFVTLIPAHREAAVNVRMMDRVFDNYVTNVTNVMVGNALRPEEYRDPCGVERARADLDRIYAWLDGKLAGRDWACGADFTLADCAAAPSIFYAD